eukprot:g75103.t1
MQILHHGMSPPCFAVSLFGVGTKSQQLASRSTQRLQQNQPSPPRRNSSALPGWRLALGGVMRVMALGRNRQPQRLQHLAQNLQTGQPS